MVPSCGDRSAGNPRKRARGRVGGGTITIGTLPPRLVGAVSYRGATKTRLLVAWQSFKAVYFSALAPKTQQEYAAIFKLAIAGLPRKISAAAVVRWHRCQLLGSGRYSASYANCCLRVLRTIVRRAATLTGNQELSRCFWEVQQVREPVRAPRCPPMDFLSKVLPLAHNRAERAFFLLAGLAGLRVGEIAGLKASDLDGDVLRVVRQRKSLTRKNRKPHSVKIDYPPLLDAMHWTIDHRAAIKPKSGWWRGHTEEYLFPWGKKKLDNLLAGLRKNLGADYLPRGAGWHSFRHWGATALAKAGASVWDVQSWLGDSDPKMAVLYVALVRGETGGAVGQIAKYAGLDTKSKQGKKKKRKFKAA